MKVETSGYQNVLPDLQFAGSGACGEQVKRRKKAVKHVNEGIKPGNSIAGEKHHFNIEHITNHDRASYSFYTLQKVAVFKYCNSEVYV